MFVICFTVPLKLNLPQSPNSSLRVNSYMVHKMISSRPVTLVANASDAFERAPPIRAQGSGSDNGDAAAPPPTHCPAPPPTHCPAPHYKAALPAQLSEHGHPVSTQ